MSLNEFPRESVTTMIKNPILTAIPPEMQTLRELADDSWLRFDLRPGCLSLKDRQSLFSCYEQSLLARRLEHHAAEISTSPSESRERGLEEGAALNSRSVSRRNDSRRHAHV